MRLVLEPRALVRDAVCVRALAVARAHARLALDLALVHVAVAVRAAARAAAQFGNKNRTVTVNNVYVGLAVIRGPHWMRHWREDAIGGEIPTVGRVVGFFDQDGVLVGRTAVGAWSFPYPEPVFDYREWCAVRWSATNRESIYPIGATLAFGGAFKHRGCFALSMAA